MEKIISNVNVTMPDDMQDGEAKAYVDYLEKKYNRKLESLKVEIDGEDAELKFKFEQKPFERIRRITGYLVGTMDTWNDAKRAEERDRVKHSVSSDMEEL